MNILDAQTQRFDIDCNTLGVYLEQHVAGFSNLVTAEKFPNGQSNPTYKLQADSGDYVLRRKPPGVLLKSAHAVDREYSVISALRDSAVPVPRSYHLCLDEQIMGSAFYIMEYVEGRVLWDPAMPELSATERASHYHSMSQVLAAVHTVDVERTGLARFGRPDGYLLRQIGLWTKQYKACETEPIPDMEWLIKHMVDSLPIADNLTTLVHGDYRLDNMMFHPEHAQILALMDWELSTLGHPFADLAYQCMQLRMPHEGPMRGLGGFDRAETGIPSEEEYVGSYCKAMNIDEIPHWEFYLAFSFFRFAGILQGVKKRALSGNASSDKALSLGDLVAPLAGMAVELLRK